MSVTSLSPSILEASEALLQGGVIAYPTEGVFGLGCDPDNSVAVEKVLKLKQRSIDKGLILLAGDYSQVQKYIDESVITSEQMTIILSRWPNAITQVLPAKESVPTLLKGVFSTIAVRITQHPDVIALCKQTNKAIVSTSANLSGQPSALTWQQVLEQFPTELDGLIKTNTLGRASASTIIDGITGQVYRG
ncbi:L-threonylcarbamoyladenylate synthase [Colwellia asteriadis]|uniref:Threonylcarbamoyl-AMP synthase n=1 Tax=Colwellia asteriadis TaxID=517723 RepID=A0ABP3WHS2_9GAMM